MVGPRRETRGGITVVRYPLARRTHRRLRQLRQIRSLVVKRLGRSGHSRGPGPTTVGPIGLRFWAAIASAVRESDAVVGVSVPYATLVVVGLVPRRCAAAVRIALPLHHDRPTNGYGRIVRRSLRQFDAWVAYSRFEKRELTQLGAKTQDISILSPGCDVGRFPQLSPKEARQQLHLPDRVTVGYVGRLSPYKGIDTMLAALPEIIATHPDTAFLVAGARQTWRHLDLLLEEASDIAGDRLIIRENFEEDEKGLLLAACDIVVCPSSEESFGMVIVEAWAAGRPVIAGDIAAVRDLVRPDVDGLLVPVGDVHALANQVRGLLDDGRKAKDMGHAGRRRVVEDYDWSQIVGRWDALLRQVATRADPLR